LKTLAAQVAGCDLHSFFEHAVRGTSDIELAPLLDEFGIDYQLRAADSASDKGGKPGKETGPRVSLGVRSGDDPLGAKLTNVFDGGSAQFAGLSPGDVVVAIDGLRTTHKTLENTLMGFSPGDVAEFHAFRRDELIHAKVVFQAPPLDTCYLTIRESVDEATVARRTAWLGAGS
jgi:predicted metalloprotease with PDZ domain